MEKQFFVMKKQRSPVRFFYKISYEIADDKRRIYTQNEKERLNKVIVSEIFWLVMRNSQANSKKINANKREILQEMIFKCLAIKNLIRRNKKNQFKKWK